MTASIDRLHNTPQASTSRYTGLSGAPEFSRRQPARKNMEDASQFSDTAKHVVSVRRLRLTIQLPHPGKVPSEVPRTSKMNQNHSAKNISEDMIIIPQNVAAAGPRTLGRYTRACRQTGTQLPDNLCGLCCRSARTQSPGIHGAYTFAAHGLLASGPRRNSTPQLACLRSFFQDCSVP